MQVLLVSMILSLLAIYISKTAQLQVASATNATDKIEALLAVRTAHSEVAYQLAISTPEQLQKNGYNFHDQVFEVGEARIEIQDLNGLISLPLESQSSTLVKLMQHYRASDNQANDIAERLINYMNPDQSGKVEESARRPILYMDELRAIAGDGSGIIDNIERDITFQVTPSLNPLTATEGVLVALTNETIAQEIVSKRSNSQISAQQIKSQAGLYADERLSYSIGPGYRVRVTAEVGDTFVRKERTIWINVDDETQPIQILEQKPDY